MTRFAVTRFAMTRPTLTRCAIAAATLLAALAAAPPADAPAAPKPAPPAAVPAPLFARIETVRGDFRIELRVAEAPISCANFVNLALRGAWDRSAFHDRTTVLRQSGGPGRTFDPGYVIRREFSAKLMFDGPGMVAMQKAPDGEHAHATQFFVTVKEQSRWNLDIPIFATVASGQRVVDSIEMNDGIRRVVIEGDPAPLLARFAKEIAGWNASIDAALKRDGLPALRPAADAAAPASPAPPPASGAPASPKP